MDMSEFEGDLSPDGQPVTEAEEDGVFMGALIIVQCAGGVRDDEGNLIQPCGTVIRHEVKRFPDGECEDAIQCPNCSARVGVPVYIPVAILVGQDVADSIPDGDDGTDEVGIDVPVDSEQPFEGVAAQDGIGPLRVVTDSGDKIG